MKTVNQHLYDIPNLLINLNICLTYENQNQSGHLEKLLAIYFRYENCSQYIFQMNIFSSLFTHTNCQHVAAYENRSHLVYIHMTKCSHMLDCKNRPDMTFAVDWPLKTTDLSIYLDCKTICDPLWQKGNQVSFGSSWVTDTNRKSNQGAFIWHQVEHGISPKWTDGLLK